jgi:ECF transporter S component (folate family)
MAWPIGRMENITKNRWMTTSVLVKAGLLAGLSIVFTRVFSFMIPLAGLPALRIGFGSLPITLAGILFGPLVGGAVGTVADLIGFLINPMGGAYFPGFTLSSALNGVIPGLVFAWMRKRETSINFNVVNGISIIAFALGVIGIMVQKGVLAFTQAGLMYNEMPLSLVVVGLFVVLVAAFVMMPVYLTKHQSKEPSQSLYSIDKVTFAVTLQYMIVSLILNTCWLSILYEKGFLIFLPGRILAGFVMIPLLSLLLFSLSRLFKYIG